MFENTPTPTPQPAEDMFAGVDPTPNQSAPAGRPAASPAPAAMADLPATGGHATRLVLIILGIVVVAALLVVGGRFLYARYFQSDAMMPESPDTVRTPGAPAVVNQQPAVTEPTPTAPVAPTTVSDLPQDTDGDGLSDDDERLAGTDPQSADSDLDGLFDREEILIYRTNPLNADSDNDGYKDGEEVKNGYNPNGPGKIFTVPAAQ